MEIEQIGENHFRMTTDCNCAHCTTKDWESVFCVGCSHALGAHSTNGPWCEECNRECHSMAFVPKGDRTEGDP